MLKFSTHAIAVALTVLALNAVNQQLHEQPIWIVEACADPDVICTFPAEVFDGLAVGQSWYEEGTTLVCPPPPLGQRARAGCVSADPDFVTWLAFTRAGAPISRVILEADSTIYGPKLPATPINIGTPGDGIWPAYAYGAVFGWGFPITETAPQAPDVPPGDKVAWSDWADRWCLTNATCASAGGTMTPAEFETMLQGSSFAAATHLVTFTQPDGTPVTVQTGTPQ